MEVLLATLLFVILSPGMVLTLPPGKGGIFTSESTNNIAVLVHSCLFFLAQKLTQPGEDGTIMWPFNYLNDASAEIRASANDNSGNPTVVTIAPLVATILFVILSPGFLLTLPPDEGALFMSEDTNSIAVIVHAVIYFIILKYYSQGLLQAKYAGTKTDVKNGHAKGDLVFDKDGNPVAASSIVKWFNDQLLSV